MFGLNVSRLSLVLGICLFVLNVGDLLTTFKFLEFGVQEANPLFDSFNVLGVVPASAVLLKIGVGAFGGVYFVIGEWVLQKKDKQHAIKYLYYAGFAINGYYTAVVTNNLLSILRHV